MTANIAGPDLIVVLVVIAAVLIGGKRIPQLARSLGSAKSEFEKGLKEGAEGKDEAATKDDTQA
jgi:sec-independent protein translocase protein TatA